MSFFKKNEIKDLKYEASFKYEHYKSKVIEITKEIQKPLGKLNGLIGTINAERHSLREEIYTLYDFLSKFNDIAEKLTPFDFEVEPLYGLSGQQFLKDGMNSSFASSSTDPALKLAKFVIAPQIAALHERHKNKKKLEKGTIELYEKKAEWDKDIRDRENYRDFCENAADIADTYRMCIATVKDAIKKQILPELQAVRCFFFADAIKENILYNKEISNVRLNPIMAYRDTPYDKHYLFVKNTYDFYVVICIFFTKPLLSDILNDETVSEDAKERFDIGIAEVSRQLEIAQNNMVFMEGN